jgi:Ca2+-binding RTX toxin-like protein
LTDNHGNNLFDAGAGADVVNAQGANNIVIGGQRADNVTLGAGNDVLAYNHGDGADTIHSSGGGADTLSLGGATDQSLITLQKSGNDLKFNLGGSDSILLKDWYDDPSTHNFVNLQIVNEATTNYDPTSTNPTVNKKVED